MTDDLHCKHAITGTNIVEDPPCASSWSTEVISFNLHSSLGVGAITMRVAKEETEVQTVEELEYVQLDPRACVLNCLVKQKFKGQ